MEQSRELPKKRDVKQRLTDYKEVEGAVDDGLTQKQASRCMDCGTPFCHNGCPLGNNIPEFNDAAYQGNWKLAYEILASTNNFPEFTGRICPAPCEASCVLAINKPAVTIEYIEKSIIEKAFELGLVTPKIPGSRTGKKIAVIGSGPAGLAAAAQLNSVGHLVTVFERADEVGGLLRYGIPDFKLDKAVLDRRINLMKEEGIIFKTQANVGVNVTVAALQEEFDAILLCGGSTIPRDLNIPGREMKGIHFAMDFLTQQNRRVKEKKIEEENIFAFGRDVIVLGGGDTGSDCVGTSNRHGAKSVTQIEILSRPPEERNALARAAFFHRRGMAQEPRPEAMQNRACGLDLVVAAITLWNTVHLERAVGQLADRQTVLPEDCVRHLSPLAWDHILLTGEYRWQLAT